MKQLILVRHAKSSWDEPSLSDKDRPLNHRGLKNAPEMGRRLASQSINVEQIITSPANRALSTAEAIATAIGFDISDIECRDSLYFEGKSSMLDSIQAMPDSVQSLMLVGHNPDMTALFNYLCGYQTYNMPTCAIARIQFDSEWPEIDKNSGQLIEYDYPKNKP